MLIIKTIKRLLSRAVIHVLLRHLYVIRMAILIGSIMTIGNSL